MTFSSSVNIKGIEIEILRDIDEMCSVWQGTLWKRSERSLNKEWKKKLVTLTNNGILTYHSNVNVRTPVFS